MTVGRGDDGSGSESKGEVKGETVGFALLDKVQEFCMSQFLEEDFEEFARKHHEPFLDTADEGQWTSPGEVEHKLEFTQVYNLFLRHFEDKISGFIEEEGGGTVEQFQLECKEALQTLEEFSPRRFFIEILLATTDYDRFYFLMVGEAKKLRREKEHARGGNGDSRSGSSSHK
ncbi:unnamed protein product [Ectocarpus sp. 4 AP-2014]